VGESIDGDIDEFDSLLDKFKGVKDVRDSFFHGQDVPETALPNMELQSLLTEFLRRHIDYTRPS
jgi:hypothetical protein